MKEKDAWDMMKGNDCEKKSLTKVLEEMGFDKDSYMVIRRNGPELKVSDERDENGYLKETERLSFGGEKLKDHSYSITKEGQMPNVITSKMNDFEAIDLQMLHYGRNNGKLPVGMTGSNNGIYSAMANGENEFILTKDPEIIRQLESQLNFKEGLGVPLSNGGTIMNDTQRNTWERAQHFSERAKVERLNGTKPRPNHLNPPKRFSEQNKENTASKSASSYSR